MGMLKEQCEAEIDKLQKQLQWHHEKARVALKKVQDK